jgi:hypothetical protein
MGASEHCAQREESLHAVKTDNMQFPVFESTEESIEKWTLILFLRTMDIHVTDNNPEK